MNKRERVQAAFRRMPVDQVPIAFWRHFPVADQTAAGLAQAVAAFQRRFDFDLVKVTPASDYMAVDWGLRGEYRGNLEGTRDVVSRPIRGTADWETLRQLDPRAGSLGVALEALRLVRADLGPTVPILQTIFSPLTTARKLSGDRWRDDLRAQPDALHTALGVIAATTAAFAVESVRYGADGIFFATQLASRAFLGEEDYRAFGERYDRIVLDAVADFRAWHLLHLHGDDVMFSLAAAYPVAAVNWHDRRTPPTLSEAHNWYAGGLVGGLDERGALLDGSPQAVAAQAADAIAQVSGAGLVLGAGCVIQINTPDENIRAAVAAARGKS